VSGRITRLLTTREVADRLGIMPATVLRWVETRGLPAIRLTSRAIRYEEGALDAWIEEHRDGGNVGEHSDNLFPPCSPPKERHP
jgi:excisionase family DNA binding protein